MAAQVTSSSSLQGSGSVSSRSREDSRSTAGDGTYEGTFEGSNSLTSSVQMREENSTCSESSSFARELSLPSSFGGGSSNGSRSRGGSGVVRLGANNGGEISPGESSYTNSSIQSQSQSSQSSRTTNNNNNNSQSFNSSSLSRSNARESKDGDDRSNNNNSGRMEVYSASGSARGDQSLVSSVNDNNNALTVEGDDSSSSSINSEDRLALRISKETKPMHHLLRMLKEIEDEKKNNVKNDNFVDPKSKAVASLISDFEKEVTLIEHRIKDENMIMNGGQPPLPPNWIALEDPDSGDIYYANEATGETQWERPGLMNELKVRLDDMNNSNMSNNMQNSNMSNNFESSFQNSNTSNNNNNNDLNNPRNNFEGSNASNNNDGDTRNSSMSNDYDGDNNMRNSNMSNNHEGGMRNSNVSNNYNGPGDNYIEQSGTQNSNSNMSSSNRDMSTLESSLTDSHTGGGDVNVLPPDWITLEDPDTGETYYANEVTGESSWDRPSMPQSMPEKKNDGVGGGDDADDDLPPDWIALEDADSGDTYFLNQVTMEATWDRPTKENSSEKLNVPELDVDDASEQPSETASNDGDLPPGWEAILDPSSGDEYYVHEESGETTWDRPEPEVKNPGRNGGEAQWEKPSFSQQPDISPEDNFSNQQGTLEDSDNSNIDLQDDNGLPPGWFAAVDEDSGDTYYCNEATGETTWDLPAGDPVIEKQVSPNNNPNQAPAGDEDGDLPQGWFAVTDPSSGDEYYVHEESGETTWDRPASGNGAVNENPMPRTQNLSFNDNTVYEDDSVTSSQY